jgi:hypothetical protein
MARNIYELVPLDVPLESSHILPMDTNEQTRKVTIAELANFFAGIISLPSVSASIDNNQGSPANIEGLIFDKETIKSAFISFCIDRSTDSGNAQMVGTIIVAHDSADDAWRITWTASMDDSDCEFQIDTDGQVTYTSSDLAGDDYAGTFKATITRIAQ